MPKEITVTTAAQIRAALASVGGLGGQGWSFETIAAGADDAMRAAGITTREGAACLVAQCMVESAYFRTTREYGGSKARYAPYYGRGFIQVTWRDNYAAFGRWCHERGLVPSGDWFLSPNEDRLADPKWAWLGAVWYFTTHRHGLVDLANKGENVKVGRAINRGDAYATLPAYGEDHRQAAYRALLAAGITAPKTAAVAQTYTREDVARLQRVLGLEDDGLWGNLTEKQAQAIRRCLKPGMKRSAWDRLRYWRLRMSRPAGKQTSDSMRRAHQWALKVEVDGIWGEATDAAWLAMRQEHKR